MPLPISTKKSVDEKLTAYCQKRVPEILHDKVKLFFKFRGNNVTLIESRPFFKNPSDWTEIKIAQMRYDPEAENWTLYCSDRNEKWHVYYDLDPRKDLDDLINEIEEDPTFIFWG